MWYTSDTQLNKYLEMRSIDLLFVGRVSIQLFSSFIQMKRENRTGTLIIHGFIRGFYGIRLLRIVQTSWIFTMFLSDSRDIW